MRDPSKELQLMVNVIYKINNGRKRNPFNGERPFIH